MMTKITKDFYGKKISFSTGVLATLSQGAVVVEYEDNVILVTANMNDNVQEGIDFFPLTVEFQEKFYATGKILGNRFMRREGRPSDEAILKGRVIDRSIRPLFQKGMINDVQVIVTILSSDGETDLAPFAICGASLALKLAGIPFKDFTSSITIGIDKNDNIIQTPTYIEQDGKLDLVVSGMKNSISMIESRSREISEDRVLEAIQKAQEYINVLCDYQAEFIDLYQKNNGKIENREVCISLPNEEVYTNVDKYIKDKNLAKLLFVKGKKLLNKSLKDIEKEVLEYFKNNIEDENKPDWTEKIIKTCIFNSIKEIMRLYILNEDKRLDGRKLDEIREISCEIGVLPRTHGTGIFKRGDTQVLSVTTLGGPDDIQIRDNMDDDSEKRYIHHYNMPPYSTGEAYRLGSPSRREIGHGNLAEKGLEPVIPDEKDFGYTIRVVSEVLTCNGSSSMASTCASTLALMDAGIPIKNPVSGIAMGLIMGENGKYKILSDIQGIEDFMGDIDFKVSGTQNGINALQMDMKIDGLSFEIIKDALNQAKQGRAYILNKMLETISKPKDKLSQYAPLLLTFSIPTAKIAEVIGPGGKIIQEIIRQTDVKINIEDDGMVTITSLDQDSGQKAKSMIDDITFEPKKGDIFEAKVTKIMDFGLFVEYKPGKEGLVHISKVAPYRINTLSDKFKIGDNIKVKVLEIDDQNRVNLSSREFMK